MMKAPWKTAWVTGASSGIGLALARRLPSLGCHVYATARSAEKLDAIAGEVAGISAMPADVTDGERLARIPAEIMARDGRLDLVVVNAGQFDPGLSCEMDAARAAHQIAVNLTGVVATAGPAIAVMRRQGHGQLVIVASVSGYRGLPNAGLYGAIKAAVISYAESLRAELAGSGIKIQLVNPGFVETPMTAANSFPMPFLMPLERAVTRMLDGMMSERFEIIFPRRLAYGLKLLRLLPYAAYFPLIRKLTGVHAE